MVSLGTSLWRTVEAATRNAARREATHEDAFARPVLTVPAEIASRFEQEQVLGLIRQVFFPGWPRPAKQVVLSGVDPAIEVNRICRQVARTLAGQLHADVALVEAGAAPALSSDSLGRYTNEDGLSKEGSASLRSTSRQIEKHLWRVPEDDVWQGGNWERSPLVLRERMGRLRREFEYSLVSAPALAFDHRAALLGQFADGVVLVVQAGRTRKEAARKALDQWTGANVRLLGVVLSERTFPVPERIYRRF